MAQQSARSSSGLPLKMRLPARKTSVNPVDYSRVMAFRPVAVSFCGSTPMSLDCFPLAVSCRAQLTPAVYASCGSRSSTVALTSSVNSTAIWSDRSS
jgi:hypothetical protein